MRNLSNLDLNFTVGNDVITKKKLKFANCID